MRNLWMAVVVVGCDNHHSRGGAASDAIVEVDAPCRAESFDYRGTFADSTVGGEVSNGAILIVHGDATRTTTSTATGAFVLCAPNTPFVVNVDSPGDQLDGRIVASEVDLVSGRQLPPFSATRIAMVLQRAGQVYDPTAGIVIAVQLGANELAVSGSHGAALAGDGGSWMTGAAGDTLLFPSVPAGSQIVSRPGDGFSVTVEVVANEITWVHVPPVQL